MILSWISFWISVDAVVARVNIGLLTVLTLTTQSTGSAGQLPRVSYIKAIDVWMSTCLVFAFASLIEFALVNVWSRREARKTRGKRPQGQGQRCKISEEIPLQQVGSLSPGDSYWLSLSSRKTERSAVFFLNLSLRGSPGNIERNTEAYVGL